VISEAFTVTVSVAAHRSAGKVQYQWDYGLGPSAGFAQGVATVDFAPSETTKTFAYSEQIAAAYGDGQVMHDHILFDSPAGTGYDGIQPQHASYAFTCIRQVTAVTVTASPGSISTPCPSNQPVRFDWTATLTPGPDTSVTYEYAFTGHFGEWFHVAPQTVSIPGTNATDPSAPQTLSGNQTVTWLASNPQTPDGNISMTVNISAPNTTAGTGTFTAQC
jgi:hypothetical protein